MGKWRNGEHVIVEINQLPRHTYSCRFLREELHTGFLRDALGSDLTNQAISEREVNLDKELIQLIQLACKSDKLQRALDMAALLHHTQSFDMAIKVVEFYHLVGLQEKIMALKNERVEMDRLEDEREHRKKLAKYSTPIPAPQNYAQDSSLRHFEDFAPPPVSVRKSLAPAMPLMNNARIGHDDIGSSSGWGPRSIATTVVAMRAEASDSSAWKDSFEAETSLPFMGDSKRKRDTLDTSELNSSAGDAVSKRRALPPQDMSELMVTKSARPRMLFFTCHFKSLLNLR